MSDNEVAVAVIAIIFGSIIAIVIISKLMGLIKSWINRNNSSYDEEKFERLAKAFVKYKKDSERRLQKLEALIGEKGKNISSSNQSTKEKTLHSSIEMDTEPPQEKHESDNNNLRNMLRT
ncbi:MAG TPA: hypothetical protein VE868_07565 [Balneolaceae bacterium]|nr:hypothetical protein [Balneolaceae bacterium]